MQRHVLRIALLAAAGAGCLLMAEIWAIAVYTNERPDPTRPEEIRLPAELVAPDPILGHRFRPNSASFFSSPHGEFAVNYQINEHGMRDAGTIFPGDRPPHVIVLGDQFAEGWGVMPEATYIAELQRLLRQREGISQYTRLFNGGMTGYGAAQSYLFGRRLVETLGADVIVFVYSGLMPVADYRFLRHATVDSAGIAIAAGPLDTEPPAAVSDVLNLSHLYRLARTLFDAHSARSALIPFDPTHDLFAAARSEAAASLDLHTRSLAHVAALAAFAKSRNIEFVLLHVPLPHQVAADEWDAGRRGYGLSARRYPVTEATLLTRFCTEHKLRCIPTTNTLQTVAANSAAPVYFRFDYALTETGHRALANALLEPMYELVAAIHTTRY